MSNRVSVVIPAYNAARFIGETIEAILQQDYSPAEIIVVNDGSTDETATIVSAYEPRVRLINIANSGCTAARAAGAAAARADWFAFCDADDLWHCEHLSRLLDVGVNHGVPFAFSNFTHLRGVERAACTHFEAEPTGFWMKPGRPVGNYRFIADEPLLLRILSHQAMFASCIFVRRDFYERIGGLNPLFSRNPSEDFEFVLRCVARKPAGIDVRPTVDIRRHDQNMSGDWIRTVAGSTEILKYAVQHHDLCPKQREALEREIVGRSIYGVEICFRNKRFDDVPIFAENLKGHDIPLKTAVRLGVSRQPAKVARLLGSALLTAGTAGNGVKRLLRRPGSGV
jgi:glycosyltransferase involved in cell wall biosynthesis